MTERTNPSEKLSAEVLSKFPTLKYLLGSSQERVVQDNRDGNSKTKHVMTEGSGMFGLKNPEEAIEWKGIFNHVIGSVRNVDFITAKLSASSEEQKQTLVDHGFDRRTIDNLDPSLLQDFMFISHAGRRIADEHAWYGIHASPLQDPNDADRTNHSYLYTVEILKREGASHKLIELMRVEDHVFEVSAMRTGVNPHVEDNILTYCDWTYGQEPTPLATRFEGLRKSGRQSPEILDILQTAGTNFENALKAAFGEDIYERMAKTAPFPREIEIRKAYAASAGLTLKEVYPDFEAKYLPH